jgi:hypothetical protein
VVNVTRVEDAKVSWAIAYKDLTLKKMKERKKNILLTVAWSLIEAKAFHPP